jgi:hypothetical protein
MTIKNKIANEILRMGKLKPKDPISKHLGFAIQEHDLSWLSDKEFLNILQDYNSELEMDVLQKEDDVDDIIKQGMNLHNILDDEE